MEMRRDGMGVGVLGKFGLMEPRDGDGEMGWVRKGWGCVRREEWRVALGCVRKAWKGEKGRQVRRKGRVEFCVCLIFMFIDFIERSISLTFNNFLLDVRF